MKYLPDNRTYFIVDDDGNLETVIVSNEVNGVITELADAKKEILELERKLNAETERADDLETERDSHKEEVERLEREKDSLESERDDLQTQVNDLETECADLQSASEEDE